ncbi:FGGY carbohydrate kinase domain-containing protein [Episyrphus balteatus]|uniref:FGGY carbohydrate kinase domain-containing protein n=1 Tax=Episyrphus balteatus TaxID=286459 RepID=UPI00248699BC|nr:FGGY carbohydrate kinase domain-containing protein [Episyrphus balteatus]
MPRIYFVGVDVGTSSARAALVSSDGKVLKQTIRPIKTWNPQQDHFEQSSDDIWNSVAFCVADVVQNIPKEEIVALSFDATCSLVILGKDGEPLSVSANGNPEQNVILWMDHRATVETEFINSTKHELLNYVGGQVSVEMEMPKLLWLKKNRNISTWNKMWRAFDLPDFLTWRSTGCDTRSLCSVVCKWNYDAIGGSWSKDFLTDIQLEDLCRNDFEIIGKTVCDPGTAVGKGLTEEAAEAFNLLPGTIVGTSLIDAHAGALGMFGCNSGTGSESIEGKMALICGTSTCHMSMTRELCPAKGVWGPYKNAIIPNFFLNEGGQSATGFLLDYVIKTHPRYEDISNKLLGRNIHSYLHKVLDKMTKERDLEDSCFLTKDLHVWPDFHGNRSPIADSTLKGMISGLNMTTDEESLAVLYLAFVQALGYGTRHIMDNLIKYKRPKFTTLLFCGGLAKNLLYTQSHADICNLPVIIPDEQEMVLVGSAMLGACAAKVYPTLEAASAAMGGTGTILKPNEDTIEYHNKKYRIFLKMLNDQRDYKIIMNS